MTECIAKNGGQNIAYYLAIALDAWGEAARREGAAGEREATAQWCDERAAVFDQHAANCRSGQSASECLRLSSVYKEFAERIRARAPAGDATAKEE
jgi:hypothetical protein